ncbi:hypothetical protein Q428_02200 [Fervidicella metallireducens AeB]|uniref:Spore germination protein n=1 Tax=Fervidicella metallireducens AeB TaxID=1403537 RepID=A0A017RXC3_9CLOT|nr:Ger(x)C family spore germination protein [Fervidicella metallireducens]EYE89433.1 hypothetical protein Q428_02200 [Fervidicella metallireducens AeB]
MKLKKWGIFILSLAFFVYLSLNPEVKTIEEYDVAAGFGIDIEKKDDSVIYKVPYSVYNYQGEGISIPLIKTGIAGTAGETRENRQLRSARSYIVGLQKIIIFGEEAARYGLYNFYDILFSNPKMNDRSLIAVCKGEPGEIFKFVPKGYETSSDYIIGMIKNMNKNTFFAEEYTLLNAYVCVISEGRNVVLPYIELINNELKITGMAVFDKDKMMYKLNMDETKIMNILRENKVTGILTIQNSPKEYASYFAQSKRKVKCRKIGEKYYFNIKLDLKGDLISNEIYKKIDDVTRVKLENQIKDKLTKQCDAFIQKMQNEYRLDLLQLGYVAAAKYGRDTGVDWNEIVSKSEIKIDINVKITKTGRGEY